MIRRLLVLATLGLIACDSDAAGPSQQITLWKALAISNYSYTYRVECFCGLKGPNPARITVRNGAVVSVTSTDAVPVPYTGALTDFPTVDDLFAIVTQTQAQKPSGFNVTYDETYHFPRVIEVDFVKNAADDEVTYRAENFAPNGS